VIKRLEDVRPGDLFLGPIGGWAGAGVRIGQLAVDGGWRVGPLDVRHIGIVTRASEHHEGPTLYDPRLDQYVSADAMPFRSFAEAEAAGYMVYRSGVITAPRMVQAMPLGAEEIELRYESHWTPRVAYARIPEDYPGQAQGAATVARAMVGIRYSWASYAALSAYRLGYKAPRLTEWIGRRQDPRPLPVAGPSGALAYPWMVSLPVEAICSVLADQAWSLVGKRVMLNTAPQAVTPSQLGQRLLFGMEGVIWGFPSVNPKGGEFLLS
jgi:hypothetical protein